MHCHQLSPIGGEKFIPPRVLGGQGVTLQDKPLSELGAVHAVESMIFSPNRENNLKSA
jgi:hypothetical protein